MKIKTSLLSAAVTGLLFGAASCGDSTQSGSGTPDLPKDSQPAGDTALAKHACKGLNACKNQGGCKTEKSTCKGVNDCKGQGGCATVAAHSCAGQNDCKNQGGCQGKAGKNECKGQGGCAVPVKH